MFDRLIEILKANPRKIVFTEGPDARILEAADRLKKGGFLTPILIGAPEEVKAAAAKGGFDIEGLEIIDPATYPGMDEMVEKMVTLRKGKMTAEQCREALSKGNYFGTMLVKMGYADALLGGATYSTADTVRPALQLVKTKPGAHLVSSCFILVRGEEKLAMGDCAINISYEDTLDKEGNVVVSAADKLAEVAVETARCAQTFGIDPKVAMLSFSTKGSGKGGTVQLSRDATAKAKELAPDLAIDGEMQFDAAVSPVVGQRKAGRADLLKHRSEQRRIVVPAELRRGDAVDPDRAGCRRIQPAQELDERRFARAVQANKRHMLPGTERKTDIVQRVMRRPVIAE